MRVFTNEHCILQVLYLANAEVLLDGGNYSYNEAAKGFDTLESAKFILHNLLAAHRGALESIKATDGEQSLAEATPNS